MYDAAEKVGLYKKVLKFGELPTWKELRSDSTKNCDPNTLVNGAIDVSVDATLEPRIIPYSIQWFGSTPQLPYANLQLRTPVFNFCIAQSIRELVPGASSAAALLLSESDQRLLLETIRERAQMAMIDFALLGVAISSYREPNPPLAFLQDASHFIPTLQDAALACGNAPYCSENTLKSLGRDFAAAVQLHSMVSEELAALLARSRSAVATRGGNAQTRAEELWGPGSWYSRLLAAMAGGDPLANPNLEPWKRPDEIAGVGVLSDRPGPWTSSRWLVPDSEGIPGRNWPSEYSVPFTEMDISEPQVHTLFQLALAYNQLHLTLKSGGIAGCTVDTDQSAKNIYRWLEAEVRKSSCYHNTPTGCSDELVKPAHAFPDETYLLWERYRIHPDHARKLVGYLTENVSLRKLGINVPGLCNAPPFNNAARDARVGPQYLSGNLTIEQAPIDGPIGLVKWRARLSDQSHRLALYDRPLEDTLPAYSRNAVQRFPSPWDIQPWADAPSQGFLGSCPLDGTAPSCIELALDSKRLMGAMAAMSASRLMLMSSLAVLKTQHSEWDEAKRLEDYFAHAEDILRVLDGSIGADGVSLRPSVQRTLGTGLQFVTSVTQDPATGDFQWRADVSFPAAGHPFWNRPTGASYEVCLLAHPAAGNLATSPDSSFFGTTIDQLVDGAVSTSRCSGGSFWEDVVAQLHNAYAAAPKGWSSGPLGLPALNPSDPSSTVFTLVAVRTTPGPDGVDQRAFQLLGSSIAFGNTGYAANGQYLANGGTLGNRLLRASQGRPNNPTIPRYDGFDLPTNWVPPFTAELIGGGPGEASVDRYLTLAKSAGQEATSAVASAMDMMVAEHRDDAAMAAATTRSAEAIKEEKQKLCGSGNAVCKVEVVKTTMDASWFDVLPPRPTHQVYEDTGLCIIGDPLARDYCLITAFAYEMAMDMLGMSVELAVPVLDSVNEPMPPAFSEYSGGSLQSAFIAQWAAVRTMRDRMAALAAASKAAWARVLLAHSAINDANEVVQSQCSSERLAAAVKSGYSTSCRVGDMDFIMEGQSPKCGHDATLSYSTAPLLAQRNACEDAIQASESEVLANSVLTANLDAFSALAAAATQVVDAAVAVQKTSAAVSELGNQASLAQSRYVLEEKLTAIQQTTSFGLYRRYRSYDIWRAKAMVDNARLYALAARRAIEARYVVDLSTLTQPEAFVQSPATWADEVYQYDLSLPAAVGLSVGTATDGGIYANKVGDYVGNLESFVMGYAASRPAAIASKEIEVVHLKGLKQGEPIELEVGEGTATVYAAMGEWSLHCSAESASGEGWVPVPREFPASQACGMVAAPGGSADDNIIYSQPDRARMAFALDPWGRLNDSIANEPYARRFNGRWDLMAVNFAGTGIKNCDGAPDPYACYSEGFIRYSLSHVGPAWITDYDGFWRTLGVPIGRIEGAKALASELWLDPLKDGWNTPYMSAVARTELQLRPLGGAYELEFVITPEIDIDRIERVQLLIGSTYWVKQD
jgi:hypothetical protein